MNPNTIPALPEKADPFSSLAVDAIGALTSQNPLDLAREIKRQREEDPAASVLFGRRCLDAFPGSGHIACSLGSSCTEAGFYGDAEKCFLLASRLEPENSIPLNCLGKLALKRRMRDLAAGWFEKALALNPRDAVALSGLGKIAVMAGQTDLAAKYFESAIGIDPQNVPALKGLAALARRSGKLVEAASLWERVLQRRPGDVECTLGLAEHKMHQLQFKQAHELALSLIQGSQSFKVEALDLLARLARLGVGKEGFSILLECADGLNLLSPAKKSELREQAGIR